MNLSSLILAAGLSQRMGTHKALLPWNSQHTFAGHLVHEFLSAGCSEVILVVNSFVFSGLKEKEPELFDIAKIVCNREPEKGRNLSLSIGLCEVKSEFCFIHNTDNPFLEKITADLLFENRNEADVIIPCFKGKGGHPILINKRVISEIKSLSGDFPFNEFLKKFQQFRVETGNENILINITTMDDYRKYFKEIS